MSRRAVVGLGGVGVLFWFDSSAMPTKLDPTLAAMLDDPLAEVDRQIVVMVGLKRAATDAMLTELRARGLAVRSVIGDVLTGSLALGSVAAVADHPDVVKIEASGPLYPEPSLPPGG